MKIKAVDIRVMKGDIAQMPAGAVVICVDTKLRLPQGLFVEAAGSLQEETGLGPFGLGEAAMTEAVHLAAGHLIYVVIADEKDACVEGPVLRKAFASALRKASAGKIDSLAVSLMGSDRGGFSKVAAAKIMAQEVLRFAREEESALKRVDFVLSAEEDADQFSKTILGYLVYVMHKLSEGPFVTVDAIIEVEDGIVLIKRTNPPLGWALPGGFVDYGESLEEAVVRETQEETGLRITRLEQFHTYSDPRRDPRFHTVSTVFVVQAEGRLKADSDAADARIFAVGELSDLSLAFDHGQVTKDYLEYRRKRSMKSKLTC